MRLYVAWEGKTKNPHLRELIAEYSERIQHFSPLQIEEWKERARGRRGRHYLTAGERRLLERHAGAYKVFLDSQGHLYSSQELAEWLAHHERRATKELLFVLGEPEGFPDPFRQKADLLLSLSRMTFTHEWTRALLLEQIYRAFTILRAYPYPR